MKILFVALFFMNLSNVAMAKTLKGQGINFYLENDTRDLGGPGSDNAYSSGMKLSYIAAENDIPSWAQPIIDRSELLRTALKDSQSNFGISLGHQIYTPNDIRNPNLIADDRPYAGWLYMGFSAHFKNEVSSHSMELDVGVVGPEAQGQYVQNGYHKIIAKYPAEGWAHQLHTEPTVQLSYQQRARFLELKTGEKKYGDVIPFFGTAIGNVAIDAHVGGIVRLGTQLPDDFGSTRPSGTDGDNFVAPITSGYPETSIYVFAAGRAIAVGRNIFLDGNSFRESHHVTKRLLLIETELGYTAQWKQINLTWRFVTRSPEFRERNVINSFASISLAYAY